jgi:DNA-nicking Smr family endonuclease
MRRLSAHERALWARVAASVKPLPGRRAPDPPAAATAPPQASPPPPPAAPTPPRAATRTPLPAPSPVPPLHPLGAPLDGTWDRQISRGRIVPDRVLDLHGHSVADAHARLLAAIHAGDGARVLLVITGKGRPDRPARIRSELMHWLERPDMRSAVASVRSAHPRHGGSGAFYVILRRQR